jgi:predicted HD superfamily hydrolase involved in NAD metabolism
MAAMGQTTQEGIPTALTIGYVKGWVGKRVSGKRLGHIAGVADLARQFALKCGCDPFLAELAGWLHDACKHIKDNELVAMAEKQGLELTEIEREHGHLLHGPVAAGLARAELGLTNRRVLEAIAEHTLGAVPMSDLSKVLFLADCLEESRPAEYTDPIWAALDMSGRFDMDKATVVACDLNLKYLIEDGKPIHPKTVAVRNHHLSLVSKRK